MVRRAAFLASMAASACFADGGKGLTNTGSEGGSDTESCPTGREGCACFENLTCLPPLECRAGTCVAPTGTSTGEDTGGGSATATSTTSATDTGMETTSTGTGTDSDSSTETTATTGMGTSTSSSSTSSTTAGCDPTVGQGPVSPLALSDLENLDVSSVAGFDVGFRCKSYTVCGAGQNCAYSGQQLGHKQSSEAMYYDGSEELSPLAARFRVAIGAASQCGDPPVEIAADDTVTLTYDGGQILDVYLPCFMGTDLTLYIAKDGSTYWDAALTMLAKAPP